LKFPAFREALDHYDSLLYKLTGTKLKRDIWEEGSTAAELCYQPTLLCFQLALVELWRSFGITPTAVMGHSFGEYAAAVCAGVLSVEDALKVTIERNRLMSPIATADTGTMSAVRASEVDVENLMAQFQVNNSGEQWLDVSAVNSPVDVMIAGPRSTVLAFETFCSERGYNIRQTLVRCPIAFHSRHMDPIMSEFRDSLTTIQQGQLKYAYFSATLGREATSEDFGPNYWLTHLRCTMHCGKALLGIWSRCKTVIEIGPREVLVHKMAENLSACQEKIGSGLICPTMRRSDEDFKIFYSVLGELHLKGVEIECHSFPGGNEAVSSQFVNCIRTALWN